MAGTLCKQLTAALAAASLLACLAGCVGTAEKEPEPFEVSKVVIPRERHLPPPKPEPAAEARKAEKPTEKAPSAQQPAEKGASAEAKQPAPAAQEKTGAIEEAKVAPKEPPPPPEAVKMTMPDRKEGAFLTDKSFVTRWNILGPMPTPDGSSSDALQLEYVSDEKTLDGSKSAPDGASWNVRVFKSSAPPGLIDFGPLFADAKGRCAFYAVSCLECPEALSGLTMHAGSAGLMKIWVNGVLVHAYDKEGREAALDQDSIGGVALKGGYNRIVLKYVDAAPGGKRRFFLRFSMPDGLPISAEP